MEIVKILLIFTIIFAATSLGVKKAKKYENRERILRESITFFKNLKSEIKYMLSSLPNAIESARVNLDTGLKDVMGLIGTSILQNKIDNNMVFENVNIIDELTFYDKQIIANGVSMLGSSDVEGQENIIENTVDMLMNQYVEAKELRQKNCKLYKTVGIAAGIIIAILFV